MAEDMRVDAAVDIADDMRIPGAIERFEWSMKGKKVGSRTHLVESTRARRLDTVTDHRQI
jgi:hypothetical protein